MLSTSVPKNFDRSIISFFNLPTSSSAKELETASILLTPEDILDSETILNSLISLVLLT